MTTYRIVQIGSLKTGWAIEIDGIIGASHPSPLYLAARLEATLRGAEDRDAALIAKAIAARPWPDYEERLAHFTVTGPWEPARDPFANAPKPGNAKRRSTETSLRSGVYK